MIKGHSKEILIRPYPYYPAGIGLIILVILALTGCSFISKDGIPPRAQNYIEMSRAALAEELDIDPDKITLESITQPTTGEGTYIIQLRVGDQFYEFHSQDDEVLLVSDPLPPAPAPLSDSDGEYIYNTALVDEVAIFIDETSPMAVDVIVNGNLRNGCEELDKIAIAMPDNNTFAILLSTRQSPDGQCTEALVPFSELIPLTREMAGMPAGDYKVVVNRSATIDFAWSGLEIVPQATNPPDLDPDQPFDTPVYTTADLVVRLEESGADVTLSTEPEPAADIFSVPGQLINVGTEIIQVYVYDNPQSASLDANRVSSNGYVIAVGEEGGEALSVDWISIPHFYQFGNLLVLYVGEDGGTLALLERVLGPPFAAG